jgi:hypothetical protein
VILQEGRAPDRIAWPEQNSTEAAGVDALIDYGR